MRHEDFRKVYATPERFWEFLTQASDQDLEGHHFDRKQAGEPDAQGRIVDLH